MTSQQTPYGRRGAAGLLGGIVAALVLAACASHQAPRADESAIRSYASGGYVPASHAVVTRAHVWLMGGQDVRLVLSEPDRPERLPLVIYLPGMGEPADAGERWRDAWSAAGYAVLSIQPLTDDSLAWQSELARDGDFKTLGQRRYAGAAMSQRVHRLADVIAEAQRRGAAGEPEWQRIDWQTTALAGFDLGAYTAMAVAGERVPGAEDAAGRVTIRAAIALSPFANASTAAAAARYRDIRLPVLSATGDADGDVIGLVPDSSWRTRPFDGMDGPGAYLLALRGLPHEEFSGTASTVASAKGPRRAGGGPGSPSAGEIAGERSRGRRSRSSGGSNNADDDRDPAEDDGPAGRLSPTATGLRLAALQAVSTAFLDATLKADPAAQAWLANGAQRWLGESGQLQRK